MYKALIEVKGFINPSPPFTHPSPFCFLAFHEGLLQGFYYEWL